MTRVFLPPEPNMIPPTEWNDIRLRQLLRYTLWSQRELAERLGVAIRAVEYWVSGHKTPRAHHRRLLDQIGLDTGFSTVEARMNERYGPMTYQPKGRQMPRVEWEKRRRIRWNRAITDDLPIGVSS